MSDVHEMEDLSSAGAAQAAGPQESGRAGWRRWWRRFDRVVAVICGLIIILLVINLVNGLLFPPTAGRGFGFGNLGILYEVNSGIILPDRVEYVVVVEDYSNNGACYGPPYTCIFLFADANSIRFQPKRGETVWVDEEHHVESLGRILDTDDIANLEHYEKDEELTISSPDEFLEAVVKLRAESAASAASADAEGR